MSGLIVALVVGTLSLCVVAGIAWYLIGDVFDNFKDPYQ